MASTEEYQKLEAENERLKDALEIVRNEDFAGQTTLSAYARRIVKAALKEN
jgi:hypothetical protein